jgi:hypothetical protein
MAIELFATFMSNISIVLFVPAQITKSLKKRDRNGRIRFHAKQSILVLLQEKNELIADNVVIDWANVKSIFLMSLQIEPFRYLLQRETYVFIDACVRDPCVISVNDQPLYIVFVLIDEVFTQIE